MPLTATGFARSAALARASWIHRFFYALLIALDELVSRRDGELPPGWFKYPPI